MNKLLENTRNAMHASYRKVVLADLRNDSFHVIKRDDDCEDCNDTKCTTLSSYFDAFLRDGFVHPDEAVDFRLFCRLDSLLTFFSSFGTRTIHCLTYRRLCRTGYRWSVLEICPTDDYSDDNTTVYLFVKDIQDSMSVQDNNSIDVLRSLCAGYDSIYCLNLETEEVVPFRTFDHNIATFRPFLESNPTYRDLIDRYISISVIPQDRSHVRRVSDLTFIRENLAIRPDFSAEYRTVYDGEMHWYRINFARMQTDGQLQHAAISLSDITDQKRIETDFYRNSKTVLVVNPDPQSRAELSGILNGYFAILSCDSAERALETLQERHEDIAVIIADTALTDMSLQNLIRRIDADHLYRGIPIIVSQDAYQMDPMADLLEIGASDFIRRPFSPPVVLNRVQFMVRHRESTNLLIMLEKDTLTGLYNKEFFFRLAGQMIHSAPQKQYAVLVSDIEHYHIYKERYGLEASDELLRNLAAIGPNLISGYLIGGRLSEDVFACLVRYSSGLPKELDAMQHAVERISNAISNTRVSVKFGMYLVDEDIPINAMCDRAILAVKSIEGVYGRNLAEFDMVLRDQLMKNQMILENAENSLNENQFIIYYQPKHDLYNNGIGGAEAVIRWMHPTMGFINPMTFVPLFERNGFIEVLDNFVLNQVCRDILEWQKNGEVMMPVSVNISRSDFMRPGLADRILRTVDSYGIAHNMVHIEITESGYAHHPHRITEELTRLHEEGFVIELDDFGTGYSSLAALSALPVDILKLDMSLLRQDDAAASRSILEFSMKLAKIMNLEIIQEGVETKEQLDRVSALGCDHVQGFYFSRPLPKDKFIAYCHACIVNPIK